MNNYIVVVAALAAALIFGGIGAVGAVNGPSSYLDISWTKSTVWSLKFLEAQTAVKGPIPENGIYPQAFGYAWLTKDLNNVLVVVTHKGIDDSNYEDPVSGFHTHVLDLQSPDSSCSAHNLEVDLVGSAGNTAFDPNYDYFVKDRQVRVKNVPTGDLGDAGIEGIVSFTVTPVENATHLCVDVADSA